MIDADDAKAVFDARDNPNFPDAESVRYEIEHLALRHLHELRSGDGL